MEIVGPIDRDSPLDLYSVTDYMSEEVNVWDMIAGQASANFTIYQSLEVGGFLYTFFCYVCAL